MNIPLRGGYGNPRQLKFKTMETTKQEIEAEVVFVIAERDRIIHIKDPVVFRTEALDFMKLVKSTRKLITASKLMGTIDYIKTINYAGIDIARKALHTEKVPWD